MDALAATTQQQLGLGAAEPVPWSNPPVPVLQLILKHVPQRQRLGHGSCCALVCSSWAEAAVAATDSLVLDKCAGKRSLQLWLQRHGHNLTQLHISTEAGEQTQLPCRNLTDLLLHDGSLLAAQFLPAMLAGLPSLQRLSLRPSHRHLEPPGSVAFPAGLLSQLPQGVAHLDLHGPLTDAALQGLSSLTKCSQLALRCTAWQTWGVQNTVSLATLQELQEMQGLTHLHMSCAPVDVNALPDFSRCTALRHLHLCEVARVGCPLQPTQLASLTKLQYLQLERVCLKGGAVGGVELLALLPQLSSLTHLGLVGLTDFDSCPAAAFTAITSNSSLQHLDLECFEGVTVQAGDGSGNPWQHIFPLNKRLLQLTTLNLDACRQFTSGGLQACVSCCPNLQELNIAHDLVHGAAGLQLDPLLQLSRLTSLTTNVSVTAIAVCAQLTGLQMLTCEQATWGFKFAGLLPLVVLQQLTCLQLLYDESAFAPLTFHIATPLQHHHGRQYWAFVSKVSTIIPAIMPAAAAAAHSRLVELVGIQL